MLLASKAQPSNRPPPNSGGHLGVFSVAAASILMTVFNCETFVQYAVASALAQKAASFDVVVVDDGSTDSTAQRLDEIKDARLRVLHCARLGRAKALNFGLTKCASRYVAILDADDIALAHRLHRQIAYLDGYRNIALAGSRYRVFIDECGHAVHSETVAPTDFPGIVEAIRRFRNPIFHSSVMFRKKLVEDIGGYDETLACTEDLDLYVRLAARHELANMDERLALKRLHAGQFFGGANNVFASPAGKQAEATIRRRIAALLPDGTMERR